MENYSSKNYAKGETMNRDQFEGKWNELQVQSGKFTDDKLRQTESGYDKFQGRMQERYGDRKEDVKRWTDEWFKKQLGDRRDPGKNRSKGKESS